LGEKTDNDMDEFHKLYEQNQQKAQEYWTKANRATALSDSLYALLDSYKDQIVAKAGGLDSLNDNEIVQRDNIDVATRMFVEDGEGVKRGRALQQKIKDTRDSLLALSDNQVHLSLEAKTPKIKGEEGAKWEYVTFSHVPATAAVTILSKFQNDVRSSEGAVVEYLKGKVGKTDFKFTDLTAKIIAPTSYILTGQQYKADIFLAAYNKGQNPEIFLGPVGSFHKNPDGSYDPLPPSDNPLPPGYSATPMKADGGFGKYETVGSGVGEKTYTGVIRVKDPASGKWKFYPFEGKYQTAPKAVVVSPTKMNVLYIGVDNPMEISVPGVGQGDVAASMEGAGTLKKDPTNPANYVANVTSIGKCKIGVTAKIDGKMTSMGDKEFRIKRIPDPIPTLGGKLRGGNTRSGEIQSQSGIVPLLENFDFEAKFSVISFEMIFSSKGDAFIEKADGPLFNDKMKKLVARAKPKDIIIIDEIKVVGPDKQPRKLGQIAFTII